MLHNIKEIRQYKTQEIHMRDPFIFTDKKTERYYLFGTTSVSDGAANIEPMFEVFISTDLKNFTGPYVAFLPEKGFWGVKNFWAPEVHEFNDKYYMFISCKGGIGEDRGTGLLVSDSPQGPYKDYSHGHITLKGHECLDGTLFVDNNKKPWIVFCHEWTELFYGRICALPLTNNLLPNYEKQVVIVDTKTDNLPWIRQMHDPRVGKTGYLTDAPFLYQAKNGELLMTWSSYSVKNYNGGQGGYVVAIARSKSGSVEGPWQHEQELLLDADTGHCSLFRDLNDNLMLCGHANDTKHGFEYPIFFPLVEQQNGFYI